LQPANGFLTGKDMHIESFLNAKEKGRHIMMYASGHLVEHLTGKGSVKSSIIEIMTNWITGGKIFALLLQVKMLGIANVPLGT
jgi:hypothetical protein